MHIFEYLGFLLLGIVGIVYTVLSVNHRKGGHRNLKRRGYGKSNGLSSHFGQLRQHLIVKTLPRIHDSTKKFPLSLSQVWKSWAAGLVPTLQPSRGQVEPPDLKPPLVMQP